MRVVALAVATVTASSTSSRSVPATEPENLERPGLALQPGREDHVGEIHDVSIVVCVTETNRS